MLQRYHISLLVILLTAAGCSTEQLPAGPFDGTEVPVEKEGPSPQQEAPSALPDNHWDPAKPVWVPYYELPEGWEISPSDRGSLRGTWLQRNEPVFISVSLYPDQGKTPLEARDLQAATTGCGAAGPAAGNSWLNCSRPSEVGTIEIAGKPVYFLRYWGDWMDSGRRVEEYYFSHDGKTRMLTLSGGTDADQDVVRRIIATLEYRYEIFVPRQEDEELGGL